MVAETATSLRRGLSILLALGGDEAAQNGGLGVTRIAELVGREKSQVSRTLKVLSECGMVDRDPETLGYRLGWRLFALAAAGGQRRLLESAPAFLRRLVHELGERAHLSVLDGGQVLTVMSESPSHAVQTAGWIGRAVPVYCTSSGRALLLDHELADLEALLGKGELRCDGPNGPRTVKELFERIRAARQRGFALVDEEFEPGLVAAAAPVRDFSGSIVAALNVSAPKFRFGGCLEEAGHRVSLAAGDLSRALGWTAEQPHARPLAEVGDA